VLHVRRQAEAVAVLRQILPACVCCTRMCADERCSASRFWWNCARRASTVVTAAMPKLSPVPHQVVERRGSIVLAGGTREKQVVLIGVNNAASR